MEASASAPDPASAAPRALLPLLTSPPRFIHLPPRPSARRNGRGWSGGLLLRPPPLRRQDPGARARRTTSCCCLSSGSSADLLQGGGSLVAAAALLAALQVVWLRCCRAGHGGSPEVLLEDDKNFVNKALGTTKAVYESNCAPQTTHDNGFSELCVSGRMSVDEMHCKAHSFSCVNTVHKETQAYSVITPWTSLDTSVDISRPEEVCFSTPTAKTSYIEKVTSAPAMPQSVSEGQDKSKYFSSTVGWVVGLPHQFLSLSGQKEVIQNSQGHTDKPMDKEDANLVGCSQSDQEEHLDLTSLSSFKRIAENHRNFVPQTSNSNLFEPRHAIEFANSYAGGSYLPAGQFTPVACLREGPLSKQKKSVKDHDGATVIGWSISNILNKENPDNFATANRGGLNGTKDILDYLKRYNSFLMDGRLKDCVDLLEIMDQKGLLDMKKIHHASFFSACKKQRAVLEALRFCRLIDSPKMSTFNMLLSVCANSHDFDGALQVMVLLNEAGLKPDCKLYTTLISTCAKCGKVDAMFEVFHEMVSAGIEPNVNTYSALIDGCGRAGQVAKAFGAYGIMSSKKVKPDRVVFNALISACGESGAVARAFDVLSEMTAESSESKGTKPILPDHVTVGALMKTCIQAGQTDRAREVYKMLQEYDIKGTPEVYTIALRSCSLTADLGFALKIYEDMNKIGVKPDEMFLSALVDVAGHARRADAAFEIMKDARAKGIQVGTMAYSSLMGACCNAKDWKKALQLYEEIKLIKLIPTVSTLNALITSLCDADQVSKAVDVLNEMNRLGVHPNEITYSVLLVACERNGEAQHGLDLFEQLKIDGIRLNPTIVGCLTGLCLQMFDTDLSLGNIIVKFNLGKPQIDSKWTSAAIKVYREAISTGLLPSSDVLSQVLGCLRLPHDSSLKNTFIENMGLSCDIPQHPNVNSLFEGFGEYDIRAFSILEEAASLGAVESISMKDARIVIDARKSKIYTAEVSLLTTLRSLKHRLAAGARLPNVTILLPTEKKQVDFDEREKMLKLAGRIGQAVGALLRRLGISYQGEESHGRMRIDGLTLRRWFNPKLKSTSSTAAPADLLPLPSRLAKGIADQQREIRNLSLE
ncbi:pentatricopeptide repeat-containing protein MRL1, chloroplastic-like isoform X2 [Phragmites australis]|uniref:pentatricopeptide repeat-containing protein MRL1, chloroplastic-like isoform X2 n=1 Tax=Phragmites australis TaxID=29695 RepID=UPI002D76F65E|nr:pentatricopeptide repeat-containing protein MRL1, chloroplastic-like isoform X2 [Phragmites australis]